MRHVPEILEKSPFWIEEIFIPLISCEGVVSPDIGFVTDFQENVSWFSSGGLVPNPVSVSDSVSNFKSGVFVFSL